MLWTPFKGFEKKENKEYYKNRNKNFRRILKNENKYKYKEISFH